MKIPLEQAAERPFRPSRLARRWAVIPRHLRGRRLCPPARRVVPQRVCPLCLFEEAKGILFFCCPVGGGISPLCGGGGVLNCPSVCWSGPTRPRTPGRFLLVQKVTKNTPRGFPPGYPLYRQAVRVKSCECLRTADSFGFLIYGTILSNFGCRPPHSNALRAALRIGAYGLLKGKIYPYIFVQLWRLAESPAPVRRPSRNASLVYSSMTRSRSSLS